MPDKRLVLHAAFVLLLPVLVAAFGWSVWTALSLVLLAILWRWAIVLQGMLRPAPGPDLVLETISASHFVEKVRWCMDRLGLDYEEVPWCGTLGAFYLGRTVPRLHFRTGAVHSQIGNSPEILRYLWGVCSATHGDTAAFLEPTAERLELERRIDRCGISLQVWIYYHLLGDPELCKHAWGVDSEAVPAWQRKLIRVLFPVQAFMIRRAFRVNESHYRKSCDRVESLLAETEAALADGRRSILGGRTLNYTDLAFAAIHGAWLQPAGYGGGVAIRIERARAPAAMRADIERWVDDYPRVTRFIEHLYASQRTEVPKP
jgi:glutathione S-transferase